MHSARESQLIKCLSIYIDNIQVINNLIQDRAKYGDFYQTMWA